jgi:hypothetical protein
MSDQDHEQTKLIKQYLEEDTGPYNPEQSLNNALKAARTKNATRDIFTLFTAWVWVLFAGFGASIYAEVSKKRKHPILNKKVPSKKAPNKKSNHSKK